MRQRWIALAIGLALLGLYFATLAPDVVGHDAGEFQFVPYIFGIPHYTGYPLYLVAAKLWTLLPLGSVAYRMNLFSAVLGAAAAAMTYLCAFELVGSAAAGLAAALLVGLAPLEWLWSIIAGVRSAAVLFVALVILAALRWRHAPDTKTAGRRLIVLALVSGLALDHHRTIVFLLPLLAAYVWWHGGRPTIESMAAFVAPLALYGILPLRAALGAPWDQMNTDTWPGFVNLTIAGNETAAHLGLSPAEVLHRVPLVWQSGVTPLALALALAGLGCLIRGRLSVALLLAGYVAILVSFTLVWNIGDQLNDVYLLPAYVPLALLAAAAVALSGRLRWLLVAAVAAAGLYAGRAHFRPQPEVLDDFRANLFQGHQARRLIEAFASLPPNATVVANWDQATPLWYGQLVDHVSPGATITYPLATLAGARQPVFLATATQRPNAPVTATGPFVHVLPAPETSLPSGLTPVGDVAGQIQLAGVVLGRQEYGVLPVTLYWKALMRPSGDYHVSVRLTQSAHVFAQRDEAAPVLGLSPTSGWIPGQVTADYYELDVRPLPPATYDLTVILYQPAGATFQNLGQPLVAAQVTLPTPQSAP